MPLAILSSEAFWRVGRNRQKMSIKPRRSGEGGAQGVNTGQIYPRKRKSQGIGKRKRPNIPKEKKLTGYEARKRRIIPPDRSPGGIKA